MEYEILKLTPDLLEDYLDFFDNVAFADHPDWAQCYCIHFHWNSQWDDEPPRENRDRAIELINTGIIQGYLMYRAGKVVGWCNTNNKYSYNGLLWRKEIFEDGEETKKVKSIVCFLVAPEMRRKGIANNLLEHVISDAIIDGYDYLEGYPPIGDYDMYTAHHGTIPLFEKHGFKIYKKFNKDVIMRINLENQHIINN